MLQFRVNNFAAVNILISTRYIVQFYQKVENRRGYPNFTCSDATFTEALDAHSTRAFKSISTRRADTRNRASPMTAKISMEWPIDVLHRHPASPDSRIIPNVLL